MLWTKHDLVEALEKELLQHNLESEIVVNEVVIDSRKALKNTLFLALKGDNNDGHNFLEQVFNNGCEVALIHDAILFTKFSQSSPDAKENLADKKLILVQDTFVALYKLAEFSRKKSSAKIIAITGSVGKTGTKEMLKLAFAAQGKTHATIGNLNNHFGLPLTLANMPRDTEFAILEMGMNHLQEIEPLSKLARPHLAIITTIAPAHIGNFNNEDEIALAKSEIFLGLEPQGIALINHDNKYYEFLKNQALKAKIKAENILSFGQNTKSDYCLQSLETRSFSQSIIYATSKNHGEVSYEISSTHKATIINSLIILACIDLYLQDVTKSLNTLKTLSATKGRGEIISIKIDNKNIIIIDDSYNANVSSMKAGIEYLSDLKKILHKKRSIAILGDMFELGKKSRELHEETLDAIKTYNVDFALLAGDEMKNSAKVLDKKNYKTYLDATSLSLEITDFLQDGDILLVKGSRGMGMEKVIEKIIAKQ